MRLQVDLLVVYWFFPATDSVLRLLFYVPFFVFKSSLVLSNNLVLTIFLVCKSPLVLCLQLMNSCLHLLLNLFYKNLPFGVNFLPDLQLHILKSGSHVVVKVVNFGPKLYFFRLRFYEVLNNRHFVLVLLNFIVSALSGWFFGLFHEHALLVELGILVALKVVAGHFAIHEDSSPCRLLL